MNKSTAGSTDIPPHERGIKIIYKGEEPWKRLKSLKL